MKHLTVILLSLRIHNRLSPPLLLFATRVEASERPSPKLADIHYKHTNSDQVFITHKHVVNKCKKAVNLMWKKEYRNRKDKHEEQALQKTSLTGRRNPNSKHTSHSWWLTSHKMQKKTQKRLKQKMEIKWRREETVNGWDSCSPVDSLKCLINALYIV